MRKKMDILSAGALTERMLSILTKQNIVSSRKKTKYKNLDSKLLFSAFANFIGINTLLCSFLH